MKEPKEHKPHKKTSYCSICTPKNLLQFYCPACGHSFSVWFVGIEPFGSCECEKCGGICLRSEQIRGEG